MLFKRLRWVLPVLLLFAVSAKADSVYVNGSYAFADHGYGIGPYGGTLNGQSASFFCVDFTHDITGNTSWVAAVTPITNSTDFSGTRLNNETEYLQMIWLATQMVTAPDQQTQAELQWAIWGFTGGGDPYGTNAAFQAAALAAVNGGFTGIGWEILTPVDPKTGSTNVYGQEFIVRASEPGTLALLCAGLLGMILVTRRRLLA